MTIIIAIAAALVLTACVVVMALLRAAGMTSRAAEQTCREGGQVMALAAVLYGTDGLILRPVERIGVSASIVRIGTGSIVRKGNP